MKAKGGKADPPGIRATKKRYDDTARVYAGSKCRGNT